MTDALVRLLAGGAWLGIATGRGKSVRQDLRAVFPKTLWDRVLIGYYNGADVALLDDDSAPDGADGVRDALADLARALREDPELSDGARQTNRRQQITLEARRVMPEGRLWDLAQQVIMLGDHDVSVTRSSHSIDIVPAGVSKLSVIAKLRSLGQDQILSIGDRGRWPGNDYALLREPWSLGVDEISVDPKTCWNLGRPGQRGAAVTSRILVSPRSGPGRPWAGARCAQMNQELALKVLGQIMNWPDDRAREEFGWLRMMARLKYDGYRDFQAGMRFIESLATWLQQFKPDERETAYAFVRNTLVYVGPGEMQRLVEQFYPRIVRDRLITTVAKERDMPSYRVLADPEARAAAERLRRRPYSWA